MSRYVDRETFNYCGETCPDVEAVFGDLLSDIQDAVAPCRMDDVSRVINKACDRVKEVGTLKLREALRQAVSDKQDIENERDDLQRQVNDLTRKVDFLEDDVASLQKELEAASA